MPRQVWGGQRVLSQFLLDAGAAQLCLGRSDWLGHDPDGAAAVGGKLKRRRVNAKPQRDSSCSSGGAGGAAESARVGAGCGGEVGDRSAERAAGGWHVLELGAGTGVCGLFAAHALRILAARRGGADPGLVYVSERAPAALLLLQLNVALNATGHAGQVVVCSAQQAVDGGAGEELRPASAAVLAQGAGGEARLLELRRGFGLDSRIWGRKWVLRVRDWPGQNGVFGFWLNRHSICTPRFNRENELVLFRGRKTNSAPKFWSPGQCHEGRSRVEPPPIGDQVEPARTSTGHPASVPAAGVARNYYRSSGAARTRPQDTRDTRDAQEIGATGRDRGGTVARQGAGRASKAR